MNRPKRHHLLSVPPAPRKLLAAILVGALFSQSSLAELSQGVLLDRTAVPALATTEFCSIRTALPATLGTLRDLRLPSGSPRGLVVYIQDVHRNAEAQENIRRSVLALAGAGVTTLGLEGSEGPILIDDLRRAVSADDRAAVARFLLKENRISGAAAAAVAGETRVSVTGIDDAALHAANVRAYLAGRGTESAVAFRLAAERADLDRRKAGTFSNDLRRFDRSVEDYRSGHLPFGAYVGIVAAQGGATPGMNRMIEAFRLESSLNFSAVESERRRILERLAVRASKPELSRLLSMSVALRTGRTGTADFYSNVVALCAASHVDLSRFPAFETYVRYAHLCDSLKPEELLAEVAAAEKSAYDRLARSPEEKRLATESRRLGLEEKLIAESLTTPEWIEYKRIAQSRPASPDLLPFEGFYRIAEQRDQRMAERALSLAENAPGHRLILITGGFHTSGISERLLSAGFAVIGFTPRLTRAADGAAYLSAFAREKTPLETLFSGERLFLAEDPLPNDVAEGAFPACALGRAALLGRAPSSASRFMNSAAPRAGYTGARLRVDAGRAVVHLERGPRAVDVEERLGPDDEVSSLTERNAPALVLPLTRWFIGYIAGMVTTYDAFLRRRIRSIIMVELDPRSTRTGSTDVFQSPNLTFAGLIAALRQSISDWRRHAGDTGPHRRAAERVENGLRRLAVQTGFAAMGSTGSMMEIADLLTVKLTEDEPLDVSETLSMIRLLISRLPFTRDGDSVRDMLFERLVSYLPNHSPHARARMLDVIRLLSPFVRTDLASSAFPLIAANLGEADHGLAISAGWVVESLLLRVKNPRAAVARLAHLRDEIAGRRSVPDPSNAFRSLFTRLTNVADLATMSRQDRAAWRAQRRRTADRLLGRRWFRSLVVPAVEWPGLPGLAFLFLPVVALASPALAPWIAPVLAGALFSLFHGVPGVHQSWSSFFVRFGAASAIQGAAMATFFWMPGPTGVGLSLLVAYGMHGAWNAVVPPEWALTTSGGFRRILTESINGLRDPTTADASVVALDDLMRTSRRAEQRRAILLALLELHRNANETSRNAVPYLFVRFVNYYPSAAADQRVIREALLESAADRLLNDEDRVVMIQALTEVAVESKPVRPAITDVARGLLGILGQDPSPLVAAVVHTGLESIARRVDDSQLRLSIARETIRFLGDLEGPLVEYRVTALEPLYATFSNIADRRLLIVDLIARLPEWEQTYARNPEAMASIGRMLYHWVTLPRMGNDLLSSELDRIADHVVRFYPRVGSMYAPLATWLVQRHMLTPAEADRLEYAHWDLHPSHLEREPIEIIGGGQQRYAVLGRLRVRSEALTIVQRPEWHIQFLGVEDDQYHEELPTNYSEAATPITQDGRTVLYYPARLVNGDQVIPLMLLLGEEANNPTDFRYDEPVTNHGHVRRSWIPYSIARLPMDDEPIGERRVHFFRRPAVPVSGANQSGARPIEAGVIPVGLSLDGRKAYYAFTRTGVIFETDLDQDERHRRDRSLASVVEAVGGRAVVADSQEHARSRERIIRRLDEDLQRMPEHERTLLSVEFTQDAVDAIRTDLRRRHSALYGLILGEVPNDDTVAGFTRALEQFLSSRHAMDGILVRELTALIGRHRHGAYVPSLNVVLSSDGVLWALRLASELLNRREFQPIPPQIAQAAEEVLRGRLFRRGDLRPEIRDLLSWLAVPPIASRTEIDYFERLLMTPNEQLMAILATFVVPVVHISAQEGAAIQFRVDDAHDDAFHILGDMMRLSEALFTPRLREMNPRPTYVEVQWPTRHRRRVFAGAAGRNGTVSEALDSLPLTFPDKAALSIVATRPDAPDRRVRLTDTILSGDTLVIGPKAGPPTQDLDRTSPPSDPSDESGGTPTAPSARPAERPEAEWKPRTRDRRRPPPRNREALDEKQAATVVLRAFELLTDGRLNAADFAERLATLTRDAGLDLDVSSVSGRLALIDAAGLLDEGRLAGEIQRQARARGGRLGLPEARRELQRLLLGGAASTSLDGALSDAAVDDNAADIAILPPALSADAEARLMTTLGTRAARRQGRGLSAILAPTEEAAARLRSLAIPGVTVFVAGDVLGRDAAGATVDLSAAVQALVRGHVDLNDFSTVAIIAPAGHTLHVEGLSPELPWIRQATVLLIDDLLRTASAPLPALYEIERAARTVASQA